MSDEFFIDFDNQLLFNEAYVINNGGIADVKEYKFLFEKANKSICKITKNNLSGSGFFCKMQDPKNEDKIIKVLFTCYHVFPFDNIYNCHEINYSIDNNKKILNLDNRRIWLNKNDNLDYVCIEIFKEDNIEEFLRVDDDLINQRCDISRVIKEKIIIFGNKGDDLKFDKGIILKNINNFCLYNCNTCPGFSGGPILNQFYNIIGIHKGGYKDKKFNMGIFLKLIYNDMKIQNPLRINNIINNPKKKFNISFIFRIFTFGIIIYLIFAFVIRYKNKNKNDNGIKKYNFIHNLDLLSGKDYNLYYYREKEIKSWRSDKKYVEYSFCKRSNLALPFESQDLEGKIGKNNRNSLKEIDYNGAELGIVKYSNESLIVNERRDGKNALL